MPSWSSPKGPDGRDRPERCLGQRLRYGDIGLLLRDRIKDHFKAQGQELNLKYIDPSLPANARVRRCACCSGTRRSTPA